MTEQSTKPRARPVSRWHPRIGLAIAVFVVLTVGTGLLINHGDSLGLDHRYVRVDALLDWYDIRPPQQAVAVRAAGHWISQLGRQIYFDDQLLAAVTGSLAGAVDLRDQIIVAVTDELVVLTPDGRLVERLKTIDGVPSEMSAIGVTARGATVLEAGDGYYAVDPETLETEPGAEGDVTQWSRVTRPPQTLAARLEEHYRGTGLTLERVLLDVHSGRILGGLGVLLIDLTAVLFLFLALSGMWMRLSARPKRKN